MAGIFDMFKPTEPRADNPGLVSRIGRLFSRERARPADGGNTTESGTSATASPSVEMFELWALRYERRAVIADIRKLLMDDPRPARAAWKRAREAVRTGVSASVHHTAKRGPTAGRYNRAQAIMDRTLKDCGITPAKLRGWAVALPTEGDLFVQFVAQGNRIVDAKRMPAASMERNTDSQDRFFDVSRAFSQLDIQTDTTVANFSAWQIHHERWNHWDGERYGQSDFIQLRRPFRNLQLMEQAQVMRRIARAALRMFHQVGSKDAPGTQRDLDDYIARNNLDAASNGGFNPKVVTKDYFGNANTSITAIPGDPNLEKIDDLEYFQDNAALGMGTPKGIIGWASKDLNRDILKQQLDEWLKEVQDLTDAVGNAIRALLDLALLLEGIDPATVDYSLTFSQNSRETAAERQERISKARQNTKGAGKNAVPDPLIPKRVAVAAIAEDYGFRDVDAIIEELAVEEAEEAERAQARSEAAAKLATPPADEPDEEDDEDEDEAPAPAPKRFARVK